jgi:Concanavalin A-like lectin/glucanases superfamily
MKRASAVLLTSAAAVLMLPAGAQAAPATVGLWHLDEPAGATVAHDATNPANNGQISGAVTAGVPDYSGHAFHFAGGVVTVPDATALDPGTKPFTVSMWLRVPSNLSTGDYNVLQKGRATTPGGQYKIEIGGTLQRGVGKPRCTIVDRTGKAVVVKSRDTDIADGRWHSVLCRRTASSVSISVDGRTRATTTTGLGSVANASPLLFGGKANGVHSYPGDMDEVALRIG